MSVLIHGMKMPEYCGKCPIHKLWFYDDEEVQCMIVRELWCKYTERHPNCPLVEVPNHGDLIDRDMVMEKAWDMETFADAVKHAPTIIPADREESN